MTAPGDGPPPDDANPFKGVPIFGDLSRMFEQQGALNWDAARQFALSIATSGESEPNVDPATRIEIEQLARVAELQVAKVTGMDPAPTAHGITIKPVTRAVWAQAALDAYRPLFEVLAGSLHGDGTGATPAETGADVDADQGDMFAMMAPLMKMMGPVMLGLTAGSMVGHLAQRCFGQYDLPLPRPPSDQLLLCAPNLDAFGAEWSLPASDLRLWVCVHEVTHHAVLNLPHVRSRLETTLRAYLGGFEPDANRFESMLGGFEMGDLTGPEAFQKVMADPEVLLGAIQSPAQRALLPKLEALVATVVGYVDHVMDEIGASLLSNYDMLTEALRRRRVEAAQSDQFAERLFGLELAQPAYDRGSRFVEGIVERAGAPGLARLWAGERELPTPAEVDAPGLWLARIDLPD